MEGVAYRPAGKILFDYAGRPAPASLGDRELDAVVIGHQHHSGVGLAMRWIQKLSFKLRAALRKPQVEREMEAELAGHLERETEELIARGASPADARQRARATMGRIDAIKQECRD